MPKINKEEYEVLKELVDEWKWIARDYSANLFVYKERPKKFEGTQSWDDLKDNCAYLRNDLFHFIQWEDREPYNVAELIKEYESILIKSTPWTPNPLDFESEDIGMKKDIEWLKKEIATEMIELEPIRRERWADVKYQTLRSVAQKIYQLDEPEVLSQKWIDEHRKSYTMEDSVEISDLQNLLVPKQEELESAIKVLIEAYKQEEDAYSELENGWISGFIKDLKNLVEEEPLYYVIDKSRKPLLRAFKEEVGMSVCDVTVEEAEALKHPNFKYRLTEQEIKDYDDRFWSFAVKVEEMEE